MPNHVTSICTVTGPEADMVRLHESHIASKEPYLDFNTIVPTPACIKDTSSDSQTELAMLAMLGARSGVTVSFEMYGVTRGVVSGPGYKHADQVLAWLEKCHSKAIESARKSFAALAETGFGNWYEWNTHNWGTKWNSYDFEFRSRAEGQYAFKFETAWSFPEPIFRKLAELYPTLEFAIEAYDEGGNFACIGSFNGKNDYRTVGATDEMYERVYRHARERDE